MFLLAMLGPPTVHPNIVENGTDVVLFPPLPQPPGPLVFVPDGTAYFTFDEKGTFAHLFADGTYVLSSHTPKAALTVELFAHGSLWFGNGYGILRMDPDGTRQRFVQTEGYTKNLILGSDGAVYFTEIGPETIDRIDTRGVLTKSALTYAPNTPYTLGPDGKLYYGSADDESPYSHGGIAAVQSDGTQKFFTLGNSYDTVVAVATARGAIYFITDGRRKDGTYGDDYIWRMLPDGSPTRIKAVEPNTLYCYAPPQLIVDFGGDLWFNSCASLYSYDVSHNRIAGPYEPSILTDVSDLTLGADDNIWLTDTVQVSKYVEQAAIGAFVRKVQTLEPAAVVVTARAPVPFTILETHFNGPWTATSSNAAVASVAPATSATGTFVVTETGKGTTTVAVRDRLGNVSYEAVTAR